jgi:hypothetical protein
MHKRVPARQPAKYLGVPFRQVLPPERTPVLLMHPRIGAENCGRRMRPEVCDLSLQAGSFAPVVGILARDPGSSG